MSAQQEQDLQTASQEIADPYLSYKLNILYYDLFPRAEVIAPEDGKKPIVQKAAEKHGFAVEVLQDGEGHYENNGASIFVPEGTIYTAVRPTTHLATRRFFELEVEALRTAASIESARQQTVSTDLSRA
jgi:hypothetical protein